MKTVFCIYFNGALKSGAFSPTAHMGVFSTLKRAKHAMMNHVAYMTPYRGGYQHSGYVIDEVVVDKEGNSASWINDYDALGNPMCDESVSGFDKPMLAR